MTPQRNSANDDDDFNLIKRDLVNSINTMEKTMEAFKEVSIIKEKTYSDLVSKLDRQYATHHDILFGDGTDKNLGMIYEMRECRQDRQDRKRYIGWVWVGAIGAFFTAIASLLVSFFKIKSS